MTQRQLNAGVSIGPIARLESGRWGILPMLAPLEIPGPLRTVTCTAEILTQLDPDYQSKPSLRIAIIGASKGYEGLANNVFWEALPDLLQFSGSIEVVLIGQDDSAWPQSSELVELGAALGEFLPSSRCVSTSWLGCGLQQAMALPLGQFDLCIWSAPGLPSESWAGCGLRPFPGAATAVISLSLGDAVDDICTFHKPGMPYPTVHTATWVPYMGEFIGASGSIWFTPAPGAVAHDSAIDFDSLSEAIVVDGGTDAMTLVSGAAGIRGSVGRLSGIEVGLLGLVLQCQTGRLGVIGGGGTFKPIAQLQQPQESEDQEHNSVGYIIQRRGWWFAQQEMLKALVMSMSEEASFSARAVLRDLKPDR